MKRKSRQPPTEIESTAAYSLRLPASSPAAVDYRFAYLTARALALP